MIMNRSSTYSQYKPSSHNPFPSLLLSIPTTNHSPKPKTTAQTPHFHIKNKTHLIQPKTTNPSSKNQHQKITNVNMCYRIFVRYSCGHVMMDRNGVKPCEAVKEGRVHPRNCPVRDDTIGLRFKCPRCNRFLTWLWEARARARARGER